MQEARGRRVDRRVAVARIEAQREQRRLDLRPASQGCRTVAPRHVVLAFACGRAVRAASRPQRTALHSAGLTGRSAHCCCPKAKAGAASRAQLALRHVTQHAGMQGTNWYTVQAKCFDSLAREKKHLVEVDNIRIACCEQPVAIQRPYLRRTATASPGGTLRWPNVPPVALFQCRPSAGPAPAQCRRVYCAHSLTSLGLIRSDPQRSVRRRVCRPTAIRRVYLSRDGMGMAAHPLCLKPAQRLSGRYVFDQEGYVT